VYLGLSYEGLAYYDSARAVYSQLLASVRERHPVVPAGGVDWRLRGGADRLIGPASRLLLGLTVSTFSTDLYSGSSALLGGSYRPGTRFIADVAFVRVVGRSSVSLALWNYYRRAGVTDTGTDPDTTKNVFNGELRVAYPVTSLVQFEPMVAYRQWNPSDYCGGRLRSGSLLARAALTDRLSATLGGRYDDGRILARGNGFALLEGYGGSVFLATSEKAMAASECLTLRKRHGSLARPLASEQRVRCQPNSAGRKSHRCSRPSPVSPVCYGVRLRMRSSRRSAPQSGWASSR
jgi:hypothetical protein